MGYGGIPVRRDGGCRRQVIHGFEHKTTTSKQTILEVIVLHLPSVPAPRVIIQAAAMFEGDVFTIEDTRFDYGETRYITFGLLQFRAIVVAHTDENGVIRIISARKATKNEEKTCFKEIGDWL